MGGWIGVAVKVLALRPDGALDRGLAEGARGGRAGGSGLAGALGWSPADGAALECALQLAAGDARRPEVVVAAVGPAAVEAVLRDALAAGAHRAVRIDAAPGIPSGVVAAGLAALRDADGDAPRWWVCGDRSADRGSGAVPVLLAAELGRVVASGLVSLSVDGHAGNDTVMAERRLERGRRERLAVHGPAVLAVTGAATRLRRAPLPAVLAARRAAIAVHAAPHATSVPTAGVGRLPLLARHPSRPTTTPVEPPAGATARERVAALTGVYDGGGRAARVVTGDPGAAADAIVEALRGWGYLGPPAVPDPAP